jgi:hypothetical protein
MYTALKKIWVIIYKINFDPVVEWEVLKSEPNTVAYHMKKMVLPVTACIAMATFVGYFFESIAFGYSIVYVCIRTISAFCEAFFSLYVSFLIIYELCPGLGLINGRENLFKLMTYSFSTFWITSFIAGILANYKTLDEFLRFLGLFGIYLFWIGSGTLLTFAVNKKSKFFIISVAVILVCYYMIHWSFGYVLTAARFPGIFN